MFIGTPNPLTDASVAQPTDTRHMFAVVLLTAQQGAVSSFVAFSLLQLSGSCSCSPHPLCVCGVLNTAAYTAGTHSGAHRAGITSPRGRGRREKEVLSVPGSSGPEGQHAQPRRKLIGHTFLACLCLLGLAFFSPLILTGARQWGGE